jgi:hypothetical protein
LAEMVSMTHPRWRRIASPVKITDPQGDVKVRRARAGVRGRTTRFAAVGLGS